MADGVCALLSVHHLRVVLQTKDTALRVLYRHNSTLRTPVGDPHTGSSSTGRRGRGGEDRGAGGLLHVTVGRALAGLAAGRHSMFGATVASEASWLAVRQSVTGVLLLRA